MGKCDCSTCNKVCPARRNGFGYTLPGSAVQSAGLLGTMNSVASIVPGISLATGLISTIGKLFGAAPRGDLQKFNRTAYPYMRTLAARSGIPVYIGWFGDAVRVNPDGSYGAYGDMTHYEARLEANGETPFYAATCPHSDCVNKPQDLNFELHDPYGLTTGLQENVDTISPTMQNQVYSDLPAAPAGDSNRIRLNADTAQAGILGGMSMPLLIGIGLVAAALFGDSRKRG